MIKLRAGRIDATKAGPTGVPKADDPFDKSNSTFAKAGFSTQEMIQSMFEHFSIRLVPSNHSAAHVDIPLVLYTEGTILRLVCLLKHTFVNRPAMLIIHSS